MRDGIPRDATGDALRRLQSDGADLSKVHRIDFYVAVPNAKAGSSVASVAQQDGFDVELSKDETGPEWTVRCSRSMVPDHTFISQIEQELDETASRYGGRGDGWGAFPVE